MGFARIVTTSELWPNGIIPYEILPGFNRMERCVIYDAIDRWNHSTLILLVPRRTNDINWI
ncbi:MAG: hypothetical protein O7F73_12025, partial [Gammaproteobacteria bacterium]|nr:hypothetical protein [Gammaproteobacteria bacterium]